MGIDTLAGGAGAEVYVVDGSDVVVKLAGGGVDRVESAATHVLADFVENLTLTGLVSSNGAGNSLKNLINGTSLRNTLRGQEGRDTLNGGAGNDLSQGGEDHDVLNGEIGNDTLQGGQGDDALTGGLGKDSLTSGDDADRFVFTALDDTTTDATTCDIITDFAQGADKIDLSALDSNPVLQGDQGFVFRSILGATIGGGVSFVQVKNAGPAGGYTVVQIDTNATSAPEALIRLTGLYTLAAADLIL